MIDINNLLAELGSPALYTWRSALPNQISSAYSAAQHGDLPTWRAIIEALPALHASSLQFDNDSIVIGQPEDATPQQQRLVETLLRKLHPWRKGPYQIHGIPIDTEWRSNFKWNRLRDAITPLKNRLVLDVGCGNGYHCWRMLGAGAKAVIGIDPTLLSVMQFNAVKHFAGDHPVFLLPLGVEDIPHELHAFDTVFSMGVLYHRKSPLDHLLELKGFLRKGGELVLETLVIDGSLGQTLLPEERYAKMRNVWFIPSPPTLAAWLQRCGFKNVRLLNFNRTSTEEQRSTDWMTFQSLSDFLDPNNPELTYEGLPAPLRAIFLANS